MSTSWTVVVRGALMKGLVSTFLASIKVKISAMSTWKHYSFAIETEFVESEDDDAHKYWDPHARFYRIPDISISL